MVFRYIVKLFGTQHCCWGILLGLFMLAFLESTVYGQILTFDTVLTQALAKTYPIKLAEKEVDIRKRDVWISRSEYLPQIQGRYNIEYQGDLSGGPSLVTAIGNSTIPAGTRFQNGANLTANWTLFTFGARGQKIKQAKLGVSVAAKAEKATAKEIQLGVLEDYTRALNRYQQWEIQQQKLPLLETLFNLNEKLYQAGRVSKTVLADAAIEWAEHQRDEATIKEQYLDALTKLSQYTLENYKVSDTSLSPLTSAVITNDVEFNADAFPSVQKVAFEIDQKNAEITQRRLERLPSVQSYTYYNFFGFDPNNPTRAIRNLDNRSITTGVFLQMPLFTGFKTHNEIEKAKLEKEKLQLEYERTKMMAQNDYDKTQLSIDKLQQANELQETVVLHSSKEKLAMNDKLRAVEWIDEVTHLKDKIADLNRQLEAKQTSTSFHEARIRQQLLLDAYPLIAEGTP